MLTMMRQSTARLRPLLVTAALFAVGCNAPGERSHEAGPLSYPAARGFDFLDIFEMNVAAGVGLHAALEVTPIRIAYGYYDATKFGMMGRSFGTWEELRKDFWVIHTFLYWTKEPCWGDAYLFDPEELRRFCQQRDPDDHSPLRFYDRWCWTTRYEDWERPWLDLVIEAHPLFVGAEIAVSPQELADFFLGIFKIDTISHDDWKPAPRDAAPVAK